MGLIKVNDRFECERTSSCWHLYDYESKKTGERKKKRMVSYWSELPHLCDAIIDRSCDAAGDVVSILDCIKKARGDVLSALSGGKITEADIKIHPDEI